MSTKQHGHLGSVLTGGGGGGEGGLGIDPERHPHQIQFAMIFLQAPI